MTIAHTQIPFKTTAIAASVTLALLAGCSSKDSAAPASAPPPAGTVKLSGVVADPYITNAIVWCDVDGDGKLNKSIDVWTESSADKAEYTLVGAERCVGDIVATSQPSTRHRAIKPDGSTELIGAFSGELRTNRGQAIQASQSNPSAQVSITPLTSMVAALTKDGASEDEAEELVQKALGITLPPGKKLSDIDVADTNEMDDVKAAVIKAAVVVQQIILDTVAATQGAKGETSSGAQAATAFNSVAAQVAQQLKSAGEAVKQKETPPAGETEEEKIKRISALESSRVVTSSGSVNPATVRSVAIATVTAVVTENVKAETGGEKSATQTMATQKLAELVANSASVTVQKAAAYADTVASVALSDEPQNVKEEKRQAAVANLQKAQTVATTVVNVTTKSLQSLFSGAEVEAASGGNDQQATLRALAAIEVLDSLAANAAEILTEATADTSALELDSTESGGSDGISIKVDAIATVMNRVAETVQRAESTAVDKAISAGMVDSGTTLTTSAAATLQEDAKNAVQSTNNTTRAENIPPTARRVARTVSLVSDSEENHTVTINLANNAFDPDDTLTFRIARAHANDETIVFDGSNSVTITIPNDTTETAKRVEYIATGGGVDARNFIDITIRPAVIPNRAPIAIAPSSMRVETGETIEIQLSALDLDGDTTLKYAVVSAPAFGTVNINETTGIATYTAGQAAAADNFSFKVTDRDGAGDSKSSAPKVVPVTVFADQPPQIRESDIGKRAVVQGNRATVNLGRFVSDPDGDAFVITVADVAATISGNTLTFDATGKDAGEHSVDFHVHSRKYTGPSARKGTVVFDVSLADQPPVTQPYSSTAFLNERFAIDLRALAYDPEGDAITFSTTTPGASITGTVLSFTPNAEETITINYGVKAVNRDELVPGTITLEVEERDVPPVARNQSQNVYYSLDDNDPVKIDLSRLASDANGDAITFTGNYVSGTTLSVPRSHFTSSGTYNFVYTAASTRTGKSELKNSGTITLNVTLQSQKPVVAEGVEFTIEAGQTFEIDLNALAYDPEGKPLTFSGLGVTGSTLSFAGTTVGETTLTYTADDGERDNLGRVEGTITIKVEAEDPGPQARPITVDLTTDDASKSVDLAQYVTYADATFDITSELATLDGSIVTFTPTAAGTYPVAYSATGGGKTNSSFVTFRVAQGDRPPVANNASYTVTQGQAFSLDLTRLASDPDGDALSFSGNGITAGRLVVATAAPGIYEVPFTVTANGKSATATVTVDVQPYLHWKLGETLIIGGSQVVLDGLTTADGSTVTRPIEQQVGMLLSPEYLPDGTTTFTLTFSLKNNAAELTIAVDQIDVVVSEGKISLAEVAQGASMSYSVSSSGDGGFALSGSLTNEALNRFEVVENYLMFDFSPVAQRLGNVPTLNVSKLPLIGGATGEFDVMGYVEAQYDVVVNGRRLTSANRINGKVTISSNP
jgi:hypothetical protein